LPSFCSSWSLWASIQPRIEKGNDTNINPHFSWLAVLSFLVGVFELFLSQSDRALDLYIRLTHQAPELKSSVRGIIFMAGLVTSGFGMWMMRKH
jgi:hypothetical protein